jgi:hypothetical protein
MIMTGRGRAPIRDQTHVKVRCAAGTAATISLHGNALERTIPYPPLDQVDPQLGATV